MPRSVDALDIAADSFALDEFDEGQQDPIYFIEDVLGRETWSKQRDIALGVRDHDRVAVRSCHGPGKTATAASIALWFLECFDDSRVITTAPVWKQVEKLLWAEIGKQYRAAKKQLKGRLLATELRITEDRYAIGLSTDPNNLESFQGHHAKHLLLIFDEASGIPQGIYEAGEGYMTTEGAKMLMIGNPTQPEGEFYSAFHGSRSEYHTIHIGYEDLPAYTGEKVSEELAAHLPTRKWVDSRRKKWGEDNPLFQVRCCGNFPKESDNSVFSLGAVEAAMMREDFKVDPHAKDTVACDVARFGSDETVIAHQKDGLVDEFLQVYNGKRVTETAGYLTEYAKQFGCRVVVDDAGVGGGVTDILFENKVPTTPFNASESPIEPDKYVNARDELWFRVADDIENIALPNDEQLLADLVAPKYKLDSKGRRKVEPKEETKKRLGRSPDRADACLLLFVPDRGGKMEVW